MFDFDKPVERRGTGSVKWDGIERDLLPMWVADMDFPAPPEVLKALDKQVAHGVFGYSLAEELPEIICRWMKDEFGIAPEESWIVLLPGVVPVLRAASRLRDGPVMLNTPNYNALIDAPGAAGKPVLLSPLKNSNEYYEMDFAAMESQVTGETGLFYLCNPHNPVGRVYTREELLELSRFARKHNLVVVSDEVHCGITFDRPHIPWFSVDDYAREQSVTLAGPAKTFNLPGLPLGFAVIPNGDLREELKKTCFALFYPGVFEITAAKAAFGKSRKWKNALVDYLRQNRDYIESRLRTAFPEAKLTHVEGTYLQWVDFRPIGIERPFEWFKEKAKIYASDGNIFGAEGYLRLNFGTTRARLAEAMDRVEERAR